MKPFIFGIGITLLAVLGIYLWIGQQAKSEQVEVNSSIIREQINNVGKLVVVEGNYSQVLNYKNTRQNYLRIFPASKKALVIINSKVTVSYDMRLLQTEVDENSRSVIIHSIPEEEVNIYPEIEYYDISQDYFNQFTAADYNKIKTTVHQIIEEKVNQSDLKERARANFIAELQRIYLLTSTMGWTLVYNDRPIESEEILLNLK
ncbi:DUF4230 domain-containing protein [Anditalea andensis]|uniref:DUF4230 domain-containing protein n=1 Tax=Anditalea andensis TaxID=1048983 RepID=A0A074KV58_9BACT|nr:DUF4230 domain-containing protein [Anditalea andensis]KEO73871.1 hypothetical protein EL17_10240 [Anditalea andensis]